MTEKGSQTSLVRNTVKGTQVEAESSSKHCQVSVDKGTLSSRHSQEIYNNQSEIAESFEFIAGTMKKTVEETDDESKIEESSRKSSIKNSESSVRNEDISNFDDSLKVAIALLNSLLESRHMKPELKRNLAGKVIQKIVQIQTSRSIQTSTLGSSGIYPLSNSSRAVSEAKSVKEVSVKSVAGSEEKSKDSSKSSKSSKKSRDDVLKDCFKPMTQSEVDYQNSIEEEPTKGLTKVPKSQLMDYVKREKQSHLKWIEKEIEHLRNLRDLLKRNETPSIDENNPLYANLSSLKLDKESEPEVAAPEKELMPPPSVPGTNVWNSHANTKKSSKSRSKLETPDPPVEESLASFIEKKNRKFIEKYGKSRKEYEEQNVYTRPYSAKKFPEGHRVIKGRKTLATKDVQTSTSIASSSVFESSDSMSVPVNSNSKTTTHYQSENLAGSHKKSPKSKQKIAETQTTDSICRTNPIFETRKKSSDETNFGTASTTVTQRINRMKNDKQLQMRPPSIRYTLTFDKKSRANVREYMSLPQNSEYTAISKTSKEIFNQISCSATLDNRRSSEDKENYAADEIIDDNDEIDLQSCLNHNRPDLFTRVEERKRCITELKKLR
jgi:hypothetical protein